MKNGISQLDKNPFEIIAKEEYDSRENLENSISFYRKFKIANFKKHDSDRARRRFWGFKLHTDRKMHRKFA